MRITRRKLRRLIESAMCESNMFSSEQRAAQVQGLNALIDDAKKVDAEFRATRDDVHQRPLQDQWDYIEVLLKDTGMNVNPPKELSIHRVVDAEEGEVLASYLTYDQAVAYGRGLAMVPADASGRKASTPVVDDRGNLYYVYQDHY